MFNDILGQDKEYISPSEVNQQAIDELWAEEEYNETMLEQVREYGDL